MTAKYGDVPAAVAELWESLGNALDAGGGAVHSGPYRLDGSPLPFVRQGENGGDAPKAPTVGGALRDDDGTLWFAIAAENENPANRARIANEKTWITGDVMELFFQPAGDGVYYEIHLTPEGRTLQLRVPSPERLLDTPFDELIREVLPATHSRIDRSRRRWWAAIGLSPATQALMAAGGPAPSPDWTGARFSLCRYDYREGEPGPEISASTFFPGSFHTPARWLVVA